MTFTSDLDAFENIANLVIRGTIKHGPLGNQSVILHEKKLHNIISSI
jgi:hypothetical protein